MIWENNKRVSS